MADKATLTPVEKNRVFEYVKGSGLDPADFSWSEITFEEYSMGLPDPCIASQLRYKLDDFHFIFGNYSVLASPGQNKRVEHIPHRLEWGIKQRELVYWVRRVKENAEAPDLWASVGQEKVLANAVSSANVNNRPFDESERNLIHAKLDELKAYLLGAQQFYSVQASFIEREFAYLREASERLGRKDWLNLLLGGLMAMAITLALEPEKAKGLLALAATAFQSLWEATQAYLR